MTPQSQPERWTPRLKDCTCTTAPEGKHNPCPFHEPRAGTPAAEQPSAPAHDGLLREFQGRIQRHVQLLETLKRTRDIDYALKYAERFNLFDGALNAATPEVRE